MGPSSNVTEVLIRRHIYRGKTPMWWQRPRLEWYFYKAKNATDGWQLLEARREPWDRCSFWAPKKKPTPSNLVFECLVSWTVKESISCVLSTQFVVLCYHSPREHSSWFAKLLDVSPASFLTILLWFPWPSIHVEHTWSSAFVFAVSFAWNILSR